MTEQLNMDNNLYRLHVDEKAYNQKPDVQEAKILSNRLTTTNVEMSQQELAEALGNGRTVLLAAMNGKRNASSMVSQQVVALDFDNTTTIKENGQTKQVKVSEENYVSIKDVLEDPFFQSVGSFLYKTFSYAEEWERFRVVIFLKEPLTTAKDVKEVYRKLLDRYPELDATPTSPATIFYGGNSSYTEISFGNSLDVTKLKDNNVTQLHQRAEKINSDEVLLLVNNYVERNADRLEDYDFFLKSYLVLKHAFNTGGIGRETVDNCLILLANEDGTRAEENIEKFHNDKSEVVQLTIPLRDWFGETKPVYILTERGGIRKLIVNLVEMIRFEPFSEHLEFNEFTQEITLYREAIDEAIVDDIRLTAEEKMHLTYSKDDTITALSKLAREKTYNPLKDMFEKNSWDGMKRVETLFIDYIGVEDTLYAREVTKRWLVGAVKRIYEPGCKFELVPVIQGKQGLGKSTLVGKLGEPYFTDSLMDLGKSKDSYQLLIGTFIAELGELASLNKTETETVKKFISAESDRIRLPFGKKMVNYKRTVAFIGTANPNVYLKDLTGNRRFFPLPSVAEPFKSVFKLTKETIQQVWAEVLTMYKAGVYPYFDGGVELDRKIIAHAKKMQEDATESNSSVDAVKEYLSMKVPNNWLETTSWDKMNFYVSYRGGEEAYLDHHNSIDRVTLTELVECAAGIPRNNPRSDSVSKQIKLFMDHNEEWVYKSSIRIGKKVTSGYQKITYT